LYWAFNIYPQVSRYPLFCKFFFYCLHGNVLTPKIIFRRIGAGIIAFYIPTSFTSSGLNAENEEMRWIINSAVVENKILIGRAASYIKTKYLSDRFAMCKYYTHHIGTAQNQGTFFIAFMLPFYPICGLFTFIVLAVLKQVRLPAPFISSCGLRYSMFHLHTSSTDALLFFFFVAKTLLLNLF